MPFQPLLLFQFPSLSFIPAFLLPPFYLIIVNFEYVPIRLVPFEIVNIVSYKYNRVFDIFKKFLPYRRPGNNLWDFGVIAHE